MTNTQRGCFAALLYVAGICALSAGLGWWFLYSFAVGAWHATRDANQAALGPLLAGGGVLILCLARALQVFWSDHNYDEQVKNEDVY